MSVNYAYNLHDLWVVRHIHRRKPRSGIRFPWPMKPGFLFRMNGKVLLRIRELFSCWHHLLNTNPANLWGRILAIECGCKSVAVEYQNSVILRMVINGKDAHLPVGYCKRSYTDDERIRIKMLKSESLHYSVHLCRILPWVSLTNEAKCKQCLTIFSQEPICKIWWPCFGFLFLDPQFFHKKPFGWIFRQICK